MWSLLWIEHLHLEWYTSRFVVKTDTKIGTCYDGIGLYAQNIDTILGSIINTFGRGWNLFKKKEKENLHFNLLWLLHLNSHSETWNDNLHDLQLLTEWDNFRADCTPKNVFRVGSAHNRTTCLTSNYWFAVLSLQCFDHRNKGRNFYRFGSLIS